MAGFEVVVRPVVLPNIRPRPAQTLPPASDPEAGWCTIKGNPAKQIDLSSSWSQSMSKSHHVETERIVDEVRVYQVDDKGKVNKDNFVDAEVAKKIKTKGGKQPRVDGGPFEVGPGDIFVAGGKAKGDSMEIATWYAKQIEDLEKGIEIRKRDQLKKNQDAGAQ